MEKIELLEKLVKLQEMHIELMRDYNNLKRRAHEKAQSVTQLTNKIYDYGKK